MLVPCPASPSQGDGALGVRPKLTSRLRRMGSTRALETLVTDRVVPCSVTRFGVGVSGARATAAERNGIGGDCSHGSQIRDLSK